MKSLPLSIGCLHFIGIGGIGMSGIAEVMHNLGYKVQGSDLVASTSVNRLQAMGIEIRIGHTETNINIESERFTLGLIFCFNEI